MCFFVIEEDDLRRAPDIEHFRLAAQLRRTLLTLDRDYLDDARFPPAEGCGVLVLSAPDEAQFERLLKQVDRVLFGRSADKRSGADAFRTPLLGRKLHVHTDWQGEMESVVILGINVDSGHARGVLMDADGTVRAAGGIDRARHRAMPLSPSRARRSRRAANGGAVGGWRVVSRSGFQELARRSVVSFRRRSEKTCRSARSAPATRPRSRKSGTASGKGARDLIAFSIGPCVSAGIISNGVLLAGAHGLASSVQWLALNPVERDDYRRHGMPGSRRRLRRASCGAWSGASNRAIVRACSTRPAAISTPSRST